MTASIAATDLSKRFGNKKAVDGVSIEVQAGELFGFLGPNGAGKTTTIRMLLGLCRPTGGDARLLGLDPWADAVALHRRIGYLPGELALFTRLTGRELLDRFAAAREMKDLTYRDQLIERFGADLDRQLRTLSKGNKQKIGIVLAFMHRPDVLVLDEPTSGLDPLLQDEFHRLVREVASAGQAVLLSSHELDEVQRIADRVCIIKEGRVVVVDSVEALRRKAARTVEFTFASDVDPARFTDLEGVQLLDYAGGRLRLSLSGAIAPVLQAAVELDPIDLTARAADLDELFRTYYRADSATAPAEVAR
ncbi:MAG: ABC transporter ATP-binding protein [Acidothermaceae bacterium]